MLVVQICYCVHGTGTCACIFEFPWITWLLTTMSSNLQFWGRGFYICFFISSFLKNSYRHWLLPSFVFLLFIVLTLAIMKLLIVYCVIYWLLQSSCLATNSYSTKNSERSWRRQGKLNRNGCCGWRSKCPDISFTHHLR